MDSIYCGLEDYFVKGSLHLAYHWFYTTSDQISELQISISPFSVSSRKPGRELGKPYRDF